MVDIKTFLDSYNNSCFDIRVTKNIRFVDQKCTPDIVCFIADCILNTEYATKPFSKTDIWHTKYFVDNTRVVYGKPYADNKSAAREYDKIASQPLQLLAYAKVLNQEYKVYNGHRCYVYTINNLELLEYIALKERNTYNFLLAFFTKVVETSGMCPWIEEYKDTCKAGDTVLAHTTLYARFKKLADSVKDKRTNKKDEDESARMMHKILNVLALDGQFEGSNRKIPTWYDLMYNKPNRRDTKKTNKTLTRKEAEKLEAKEINEKFYIGYIVTKAKRNVHKIQGDISEVDDELAQGIATAVHHIFPQAKYPMIASYYENLILLTANQHYQKAHPNNKTQIVSKEYQYVCLMAKSHTIEKSIAKIGEDFYSRAKFIKVINVGLNEQLEPNEQLVDTSSFDDIRSFLTYQYIQKA